MAPTWDLLTQAAKNKQKMFGMLKTRLRRVVNSAQNDESAIHKDVVSRRIASPLDCFQQLHGHFDNQTWRDGQTRKKKPMTRITVSWTDIGKVQRPQTEEDYESVTNIGKSHQFFVIAKGRVATRQHSCWCLACHTRINKGGAKFSGGDANGCEHAQGGIYKWTDESCAQKGGSAIQTAWKRAKVKRAQAAMSLTMGTWCLLLAPDDDEEEFWLAQTVPVDAWNGACSKKHSMLTMVNGRRFDAGDVEIAVQYYGPSWRV